MVVGKGIRIVVEVEHGEEWFTVYRAGRIEGRFFTIAGALEAARFLKGVSK